MSNMSQADYSEVEELMAPIKLILDNDLEYLRRKDEEERVIDWNDIKQDFHKVQERFAAKLPRDIMLKSRSQFAFAKLLLAAAAYINDEESPILEIQRI